MCNPRRPIITSMLSQISNTNLFHLNLGHNIPAKKVSVRSLRVIHEKDITRCHVATRSADPLCAPNRMNTRQNKMPSPNTSSAQNENSRQTQKRAKIRKVSAPTAKGQKNDNQDHAGTSKKTTLSIVRVKRSLWRGRLLDAHSIVGGECRDKTLIWIH